ncbi:MAG TPA: hypoxanthine phosphoribosyltransferase [Acidimicrobiales bacterium]|nr:hypoxanthine phosphoribosyltransferase [Acidimicrobiales bacterium]
MPAEELAEAATRIAAEISAAHTDGVVLVAVLKGSIPFLADLVRRLTIVPVIDFMAISAYAPETGRVRIVKDLDMDISGRDVVLVEDIVDTGLTLHYLLAELGRRNPRSLEACTLLDRTSRRIIPTPVRYRGFEIGDEFVLGYGLDFAQRYRNLDRVVLADVGVLREDPDAYVPSLYRR